MSVNYEDLAWAARQGVRDDGKEAEGEVEDVLAEFFELDEHGGGARASLKSKLAFAATIHELMYQFDWPPRQASRVVLATAELWRRDEAMSDDERHHVVELALIAKDKLDNRLDWGFDEWWANVLESRGQVSLDVFEGDLDDLREQIKRDGYGTTDWHEQIDWRGQTFCVALL